LTFALRIVIQGEYYNEIKLARTSDGYTFRSCDKKDRMI
jgi:hypothetical protein